MQRIDGVFVYSPTDLVRRMECDLVAKLEAARIAELFAPVENERSATLELAKKFGDLHEKRALASLIAEHGEGGVVRFDRPAYTFSELQKADEETRAALASGVPVIFQPTFFDGQLVGHADFLIRTDGLDSTGCHVYEPFDTKLSRKVKPGALLQLGAYAEQMLRLGAPLPERVWVWLGDGTRSGHDTRAILPLVKHVRRLIQADLATPATLPHPSYASPRTGCEMCTFDAHCDAQREIARDLSLVAGLRHEQRRKLEFVGLRTVESLGAAAPEDRPPTMARETFDKLRAQARMQAAQDASRDPDTNPDGTVGYEDFGLDRGTALVPRPDPGDVFFDMEGDAFAEEGDGLEYLFGVVTVDTGVDAFHSYWAHSRAEEKVAFENFVDWLDARLARYPDAHVYHYAAYEASALARLARRHSSREELVDDMLRGRRFVNLYPTVTRNIRVSQRSYSIKKLEPLYLDSVREGDVTTADDSIEQYERAVEARAEGDESTAVDLLREIERYNERDCVSTRALRDWLVSVRPNAEFPARAGTAAAANETSSGPRAELESEERVLVEALLGDVPDEVGSRTVEDTTRAMLAACVVFHRREDRVKWQDYFRKCSLDRESFANETDAMAILSVESGPWTRETRARSDSRELHLCIDDGEPTRIKAESRIVVVYDEIEPTSGARICTYADVVSMDERELRCREKAPSAGIRPESEAIGLFEFTHVPTTSIAAAIRAQVRGYLDGSRSATNNSALALLDRVPSDSALPTGGDTVDDIVAALTAEDRLVVGVQGPPGTGKTYVGSRVVAKLVSRGWQVGVVAQSHAAVANLIRAAAEAGVPVGRLGKPTPTGEAARHEWERSDWLAWRSRTPGGLLLGGTAWSFTGAKFLAQPPLDLLIVEEAGQFSLANTVAASAHARRILLLGDPQQLGQVTQGTHPEPVDESALRWWMGDASVMPASRGYFLGRSFRMHPSVCRVVSDLAYDGKLASDDSTTTRGLDGVGAGVLAHPVAHTGWSTHSPEEVSVVVDLVRAHLGRPWNDGQATRPLSQQDVLVVAPFNAQRAALLEALVAAGYDAVRVGTVDKFQGLEAPVVLVSMTTSSADQVPRGLGFLLSTNRLNVAISRAQWLAIVVYSPKLAEVAPSSPVVLERLGRFLGVIGAETS